VPVNPHRGFARADFGRKRLQQGDIGKTWRCVIAGHGKHRLPRLRNKEKLKLSEIELQRAEAVTPFAVIVTFQGSQCRERECWKTNNLRKNARRISALSVP
jgi:hypothetical protein